jgi:hypothetical protein
VFKREKGVVRAHGKGGRTTPETATSRAKWHSWDRELREKERKAELTINQGKV